MIIDARVTETKFNFKIVLLQKSKRLGELSIPKPSKDCAEGWMERGHAKTKEEAIQVAIRNAGY